MSKPSKKERLRLIFELVDEEMQYFRVLTITPNKVRFLFRGDELTFRYEEGRLFLSNSRWLSSENYVLLYRLAEQMMRASLAGFKEGNQKKTKKLVDAQLRLFKPAQLPLQMRRSK